MVDDLSMNLPREDIESLVAGYGPPGGFHDEFLEAPGRIRPVWSGIAAVLENLGAAGLSRRMETLNRLIREYGVTYNVYSEGDEHQSSWAMDVVPFMLDGREWAMLEDALSQRFHLLDLILKDCYGEQRLLAGGRLPPDLVLGNPSFLTACHGLLPSGFHHMQLYCADLARSPDGHWWVLSDRLDAASGLGYALENRMLSHRVIPEAQRPAAIRPLQPFVAHYCETIEGLAPHRRENPTVVLLTPGPHNETYFEHAFLARTLGYPLVEGDDLTVRNGKVYLKTITGLEQVDVIVRRLDADWCDPLELRSDSLLGVPGLLQAVRSGNVAVANGLGCGLLQAPACNAFLPGLCRLLLGEDLKIPSVATWWCGHDDALKYVLDNLHSLVVKPAVNLGLSPAVFGDSLSGGDLEALRNRLIDRPHDWCAQEMVANATTPSFDGRALFPTHFLMRVYLIRHRGGYRMMPGGLARAAPGDSYAVSMQTGGVSKDVWVSGAGTLAPEIDGRDAAPMKPAIVIRRSAHTLPSRIADNLFWLGRYFERTESQTRLARALITALMDEALNDRGESTLRLFAALAPDHALKKLATRRRGKEILINLLEAEKFLREWFFTEGATGGLRGDIRAILRTARGVKERLSLDAWHAVSNLDELGATLPDVRNTPLSDRTLQVMDDILGLLSSISGLSMENMTRGHGWHFQELGRRIERALHLSNWIYSMLTPPSKDPEPILWLILECSDSLITYRRRYFTAAHAASVLDLLLCDPLNPRSMAFQVNEISRLIAHLPHHLYGTVPQSMDKTALRLSSLLGLCEIEALDRLSGDGHRRNLAVFLDELSENLCALSEQIGSHYFAITVRPEGHHGHALQDSIHD